MKTLFSLVLISLSTALFAGDAAKVTSLGFSPDGSKFAFMESGIQDGSGFVYARVKFIDTLNNTYAAPVVSLQLREDLATIREGEIQVLNKASRVLEELNISGLNPGDHLLSRKISDIDARSLNDFTFSNGPLIGGLGAPKYQIILSQFEIQVPTDRYCLEEGVARILKLELKSLTTGKVSTLQKDEHLPKERGCVFNYEVEEVIVHNPAWNSDDTAKIVILLRVFTMGFEGEDVRYMAVSGKLLD